MLMPTNAFKKGFKGPTRMLGVWAMSGNAVAAEALGFAGYDFVVLDMEHGPNDVPRVLSLLQAMAGTPAASVVRLPWNDFVVVKQLLDCGAQTLMFPYIQSSDEARRAVAATRYPKDGIRGVAEYVDKLKKERRADATITKVKWLLDFAYPTIGDKCIWEIDAATRPGAV